MAGVREAESFIEALAAVSAAVDRVARGRRSRSSVRAFRDALTWIETGLLERHSIREVGIGGYPKAIRHSARLALSIALQAKCEAIEARGMRPSSSPSLASSRA